ncbi:endomembrane protein 70 [Xylariaceae sp. FL1272]|nr:endomembrane protein 70 [Xylariaceae sp. FL1272]
MLATLRNGLRWLLLALILSQAEAFYIPGWSIKSYQEGEHIPLMVNKVYSDNTQLQYAYYDLPFVCPPTGKTRASGLLSGQSISLNLGEVLRGDRIVTSDIDLTVGHDNECSFLCGQEVTRRDLRRARDLVKDGYVVEWIVDNLPGATSFVTVDKTRKYYAAGFKLGFTDYSSGTGKPRYFLNNHHTIVIRYRSAPGRAGEKGGKVVVGFEVYTKSIGPNIERGDGCPADLQEIDDHFEIAMQPNGTGDPSSQEPMPLNHLDNLDEGDDDETTIIPYSYSVYFREDDSIEWDRRWDLYFVNQEEGARIHWLAISNSVIICGLLSGLVVMILSKTIRTDIKSYKENVSPEAGRKPKAEKKSLGLLDQANSGVAQPDDASDDEALEDVTGWKLLHGDVFRRPQYGHLLAPLVGSGMQLLFMAVGLILLSAVGVLNPSFRGGFLSFGFGLFVFAGVFSGYFSAKVYKGFGGVNFGKNALITACFFPGLLFGLIFMLNLFVWAQASSTAIPFGTLIAIALLWLCIQVPLVYLGSWYGHAKSSDWENPTKTSAIPRQVPRQAWYIKSLQSILLAGLIPFTVIFIELLFVFQSIWQDKSGFYYVFGFLGVVSLILIVTVAEVTIVTIYVQLGSENYHWWWQSFAVGGGSAVWVFVYSIWYYMFKLHITGFVSSMLFFAYSFIACCVYGLLTGTVGFLSAYAFIRRLYGAIKID